jgi:hypothetical protein
LKLYKKDKVNSQVLLIQIDLCKRLILIDQNQKIKVEENIKN